MKLGGRVMKYRIHDGNSEDSLVIEGETFEEMQIQAQAEADKRGWKSPWSEKIESRDSPSP